MVSAPRAWGLLTLLLLPLPGARGQCGAPPRLRRAIPRDTNRTEGFPINTEVTYKCLDCCVKIPGKSDTVVCLSNSEWSTVGECCGPSCGAPPRIKSAALNKEDEMKNYHPSGTTVSYVCRPGYEQTELRPVVTCLENLTWSEAPEFCRGKSCGVPKGPEHGRAVDVTNDLYSAKVNIICDDGFRLRGQTFIQCLLKGDQVEWSQPPTCQEITCSPPPNIANGMHNGSNVEIFDYNSSVTYKCDHNFSLTGEASIQCTTKDNINGVWNGSAPECKDIITQDKPTIVLPEGTEVAGTSSDLCEYPPRSRRAVRRDTNGREGLHKCRDGSDKIPGKSDTVVCLSNSEWSTIGECCGQITCFPPPNITNGMHNGSNVEIFGYNSSVTYECDHNFSLIGEASIHCTTKDNINGVWNGSAPECKGLCSALPRLRRDTNLREGVPINTEVTYKCPDGSDKISGKSDTVVCLSNSEWSTIGEFCGRHGIDRRISGAGTIIVIIIGICLGAAVVSAGIFAALTKKWQNKKRSYGVNPDSQMSETTSNLILKV